jgi:hypothetical protein
MLLVNIGLGLLAIFGLGCVVWTVIAAEKKKKRSGGD